MTGPAGSGKTTRAREWRLHDPGFMLCATTGIAAVNLGDAVTVHSTLGFYNTASLEESFIQGFLQARMRKLRAAGVTRYGIDEVSMLSGPQLTIITQAVEELNSEASVAAGHEPEIGITLIGDFLQLPPVNEPYAFESSEWAKYEPHTLVLKDLYRQTDADFITALRAVRQGDPTPAMDILRPHMHPQTDYRFPGVTILGKNMQVARVNKLQHDTMPGEPMVFKSEITMKEGEEPLGEWVKEIPIAVALKPGARVMILANKYLTLGDEKMLVYANGDVGDVVDGDPEKRYAHVQLHRTGEIVTVGYNVRQKLRPTGAKGKKKDAYEVLGEIEYMPLRLAYCTSVHKCVTPDTRVLVEGRGSLPVEALRVNDWVDTGSGPARVIAIKQTLQYLCALTTERGYVVTGSADHRWKFVDADGVGEFRELARLRKGDRVLLTREAHTTGTREISDDVAWWLGVMVGDGNWTDRREGQLHFTNSVEEIRTRWMRIAAVLGGRPNTRRDKRGCHLSSLPLRLRLEAWGCDYVTAAHKRIPAVVWRSGPAAWAACLQGLFDADGHAKRHRIVFTTRSPRLAEEVQLLLLYLGIPSTKGEYPGRTGLYWHVRVSAEGRDRFCARVGASHPKKAVALRAWKPNRQLKPYDGTDRVRTVTRSTLAVPMYDIELETIHELGWGPIVGSNSQGLTLDRVQVDISDPFFRHPAMVYVALSRARSLEGLRLVGNPDLLRKRCTVDPKVERWR